MDNPKPHAPSHWLAVLMRGISCILLLSASAVYAKPGLFPIIRPDIPELLKEKSKSVFRLVSFYKKPLHYSKKEYEKRLLGLKDKSSFKSHLSREFISQCQKQKLPSCEFPYFGISTAFLVEDKHTLITTLHSFDSITCHKSVSIDLQLYDQAAILVFDTRSGQDKAELRCPARYSSDKNGKLGEFDVAQITLNRDLPVPPLEWENSPLNILDEYATFHLLSFPSQTADRRTKCGNPDSDGQNLSASIGCIHPFSFKELRQEFSLAESHDLNESILNTDLDAAPGSSGAPFLNKWGNVIGILRGAQDLETCHQWISNGISATRIRSFFTKK